MKRSQYLLEFFKRHGHLMMASSVVTKLMGFAAVVFVTRHTSALDYGSFSYAMNLVGVAVPFMGLGAYQSFLRFAPDSPGQRAKKVLFNYAFTRGLAVSICIVVLLQCFGSWFCRSVPSSVLSFRVLSFVVLSTMVMECVKGYARSIHLNHIAASIDVIYAIALVSSTILLTTEFGIVGYSAAIVVAPLCASVWYASKMKLLSLNWCGLAETYSGFWSYGLFTTLGALLAKFFYAIDVLVIGQSLGENAETIAIYRVALLIPMATLVLPISVAATDFVSNSAMKAQPSALRSYLLNYWKTFGLLSAACLAVLGGFAPQLLSVFGKEYIEGAAVMRTFLIGMLGAHVLRVPMGHLLAAVGRADLNTYTNAFIVVATLAGCLLVVPVHGIEGAAAVMASMLWLSGLIYAALFEWHLRSVTRGAKQREHQKKI